MKALFLTLLLVPLAAIAQVKAYPPEKGRPGNTGKIAIQVKALAVIDGPRVLLGEIANIDSTSKELATIDLGAAPVAGIPRPVTVSRIQSALIMAGFKVKDFEIDVPAGAKVAVKTQPVPHKQFVDTAIAAIRGIVGEQVGLSSAQTLPDFEATMGEVQLEAGNPSKFSDGYSVLVSVTVNGKRVNSRLIKVQMNAKSTISISAGSAVKIFVRSGGATIELQGRAKTSGFAGQQISVISSTGSVHQATVLSATEVEVKM